MQFRPRQYLLQWLGLILMLVTSQHGLAAGGSQTEAVSRPPACLQGTFIQLVDENRTWPRTQWESLFKQFQELKINRIVLQWTVIDGQAFYPSHNFKSATEPVVEWIMSLADTHGMEVMVGLTHQSNHWDIVGKAEQRPKYLAEELARIAQAVDELGPLVTTHKSFRGWYISQEVDDLNWMDDVSNESLRSFLVQASTLLKTLTPRATIGVSAFANKATAPQELELFWSRMLARVQNLDTIYFQDGIGVYKLDLAVLSAYYNAMHTAAKTNKREMMPVIEIFEQTSGMPLNNNAFSAKSAPLERILRQVSEAENYSAKHIAFSVPEYLSSMKDGSTRQAYDDYISYMREKKIVCSDN
ncbi:DUF4434 domain-containing protein [Noviherbaspirillum suwonense]|uniref:DUF4434 domain-containing protein n=1 Tax=Noviherbaspirillum suwonense TaxID=1224511 RepID=A0ABY1QI75_9BURK|nr:DUF4434 domain-containing protein [Noviherbaspirillum suwonense]RYZ41791.1 MAG: DUF4434 domain-containing protein [Sphingobacteriales bacterium]SMP71722.1 protein of unknown function [Noviherbaspirillum suwonense]